jgi:hypothetical protein
MADASAAADDEALQGVEGFRCFFRAADSFAFGGVAGDAE